MVYALMNREYDILKKVIDVLGGYGYRLVAPIHDGAIFTADDTSLMQPMDLAEMCAMVGQAVGFGISMKPWASSVASA